MSLSKRNRPKAATETVDAPDTLPPRALPSGETEVIEPEEVKPLGAHNSPGNTDARAAFLKDEANETIEVEGKPGEKKDNATESLPAMSFEEMASIAAAVTNSAGAMLGPKLTKRKDIDWTLSANEVGTLEKAYAPVLKEALADTKVTPMTVLVTVLLSCYAPRALYAFGTKPPEEEKKPEQKPETVATVANAPVEEKKPEPEKQGKEANYGW